MGFWQFRGLVHSDFGPMEVDGRYRGSNNFNERCDLYIFPVLHSKIEPSKMTVSTSHDRETNISDVNWLSARRTDSGVQLYHLSLLGRFRISHVSPFRILPCSIPGSSLASVFPTIWSMIYSDISSGKRGCISTQIIKRKIKSLRRGWSRLKSRLEPN